MLNDLKFNSPLLLNFLWFTLIMRLDFPTMSLLSDVQYPARQEKKIKLKKKEEKKRR